MTEWKQELVVLLEAEFHARRVLGALATVDADGCPRARMVFIRHIDEREGTLSLTTDARSEKIKHLAKLPMAELVFWTPHERQQFRLLGEVEVVRDGSERIEQWRQMNETSRAMFYWPAPGKPRTEGEEFVRSAAADQPPESFVLLVLRPTEVESLELNDHPHCRRRWREAAGWAMELINP